MSTVHLVLYLLIGVIVDAVIVLRINATANKKDVQKTGSSSTENGLNNNNSFNFTEVPLGKHHRHDSLTKHTQGGHQLQPTVPEVTLRTSDDSDLPDELQQSVVRLLETHHEYEKGIHALHEMIEVLQKDFLVVRSQVNSLLKSSATASKHASSEIETKRGFYHNQLLKDQLTGDTSKWIFNLTSTAKQHELQISNMDRRYKYLNQHVNVRMEEFLKRSNRLIFEVDTVRQFANKQKEINTNLQRKLQSLERILADMNVNSQTQADSPMQNHQAKDCPSDYIRHYSSCYKFVNITSNWIEAEKYCQKNHHGSHLVSIETKTEEEFLVRYRIYNNVRWSSRYIWIGANDMAQEGDWTWLGTGSSLIYTNWRAGQPDNRNNDEHCVYLRLDGINVGWDDWHCYSAKLNFVCEILVQL